MQLQIAPTDFKQASAALGTGNEQRPSVLSVHGQHAVIYIVGSPASQELRPRSSLQEDRHQNGQGLAHNQSYGCMGRSGPQCCGSVPSGLKAQIHLLEHKAHLRMHSACQGASGPVRHVELN